MIKSLKEEINEKDALLLEMQEKEDKITRLTDLNTEMRDLIE